MIIILVRHNKNILKVLLQSITTLFIIVVSALCPLLLDAQTMHTGTVVNKTTRMGVPFATIGLMKMNTGTNANDSGYYQLNTGLKADDTLIVSSVGYFTAKIPTSQVSSGMVIDLEEKLTPLKEILIAPLTGQMTMINQYNNCGLNSYFSAGFITQIAQHFAAPVANSRLKEIQICKQGDQSIFRLRIYSVNPKTGAPDYDLADTLIEINSSKKKVDIDVSKYNILFPETDFFIAVEWLKIPQNERNIKSKINNNPFDYVGYSPYLFLRNQTNSAANTGSTAQVWQLTYQGKWLKFYDQEKVFLISALVAY